jgi:hypothetical protein
MCFDDDNNSLNAAMSTDGRESESIFWNHEGDVVAMRLRIGNAVARRDRVTTVT